MKPTIGLCHALRRTYSTDAAQSSLGGRTYRVAVCGAGPSGFYASGRLLSLPGSEKTRVDLFERLPVPFGLSRYGVAPDHPEVKNCEHKFEETAQDPRFRFFGGAQLGGRSAEDIGVASDRVPNSTYAPDSVFLPLELLRSTYDAVLLTYGASLDRMLDIPGELDLLNVLSARTFVNWYNGHPYASPASGNAPLLDLSKVDRVSIVGQGNVALDVARVLLTDIDALSKTDMAEYALAELARSKVKHVEIVGRRGPLQIACTTKEVRELMNLPGVGFSTDADLLKQSAALLEQPGKSEAMSDARMKRRLLQLMQKGSKTRRDAATKEWSFKFLRGPIAFLGDPSRSAASASSTLEKLTSPSSVKAVEWQENELVPSDDLSLSSLAVRSLGPEHRVKTQTDLVFKSVGYRSVGIPGLPFDDRKGVAQNEDGRVVQADGSTLPGLYVSGWLSRGPSGVIANTMYDAFSTADLIAQDLARTPPKAEGSDAPVDVSAVVKDPTKLVPWSGWQRIDREERRRGAERGKVREKVSSVGEMLELGLD